MTSHLVYAPIDMRAFNRWAGQRGLVRRGTFDHGYALHVLLSSMFGKVALRPFRLFASSRRPNATLYAYADVDQSALRRSADRLATPDCLAAIDVRKLLSKPMRTDFSSGQRLGFDIRVRPVRRLRHELPDSQSGRVLAKGAEIDVFRVDVLHRFPDGPAVDDASIGHNNERRRQLYLEWLAERLGAAADIDMAQCRLASFQRTRALRGDGVGPEGPDATLHGVLTVRNTEQFASRVRNGVGRHRAYGYGMVLLRPPGTSVAM